LLAFIADIGENGFAVNVRGRSPFDPRVNPESQILDKLEMERRQA